MDRIPSGPGPNIKYVGDGRMSSALRRIPCFDRAVREFDEKVQPPRHTGQAKALLRREMTFDVLREKPSLTLRLAKSKHALRQKASTFFGKSKQVVTSRADSILTKNIVVPAPEPWPFHPSAGMVSTIETEASGTGNTSSETVKAVPVIDELVNMATTDDSTPAIGTSGLTDASTSSPACSWTATPASKVGSSGRSRQHHRSLAYNKYAEVRFCEDVAEMAPEDTWEDAESEMSSVHWKVANSEFTSAKQENANITSSREWSSGDEDEDVWIDKAARETDAQASPTFFDEKPTVHETYDRDFSPTMCSMAVPIRPRTRPRGQAQWVKTIVPSQDTPSSLLDSDVFDTALLQQEEADKENAESIQTVIIHSDAILLESAMEVNTSSTVPSSETKAASQATTTHRVEQVVHKIEDERNRLAAENKAMVKALRSASHQTTEYRQYIEQLRRNNYQQERKLEYVIHNLHAEIDGQNHEMEQMRQLIAYKEGIEEELKATIEAMAGDGFKVLTGDEAVEELRSMQS